ncbi:MAG: peptidylprolyl isomerase [Lonepinella koalarum]|nr:peptidylprolyl isomerase [Lonepinella koalarum]
MKNTFFKSFFLSVVGLFAFSSSIQAVEQVVATVDGVPILESQIKRLLGKRANNESNRAKALDSIIDDLLLQKAIKESGVSVSMAQVDNIIEGIAAQNGLTYGQLLDALEHQGMSLNQFRSQIHNQILMGEVRNRSIGKHIDVTREQVEALSKQLKQSGTLKKVTATEYRVRHILLKLNPMLNDAQAKAQLTQIRADILAGKTTFEKEAIAHSKDYLSGANGGDLGFAFPESYVGPFAQTVKTIKKGQISAPFKTEFGWHILEVIDTREGDRTEDAYMQKAYETLVNQQLQDEAKDWIKALRKGADIQIFTK